ncbi:BAG family molecular chaperone regulator 4-like protein [Tanacetum coccineum]
MLKKSTTFLTRSKPKAASHHTDVEVEVEVAIDWEVRPGGMLVQKRLVGSDHGCTNAPVINIKVSHNAVYHSISIPPVSTFGDLKKILARETNLEATDQRLLFKGKEKGDDERLDMAGVKDMSKIILMEDPASKERKLVDKSKTRDNVKAYDAVLNVRTEVDKLSHKVRVIYINCK